MKLIKPLFLSATTAFILASCGSTNVVSTPITNIDSTPLKVSKLTEVELNSWSHLDLVKDTIPGMSVDKAYEFLKGKKGKTVVVGVIDSGVDIEHEDLKNVLWTNKKEVANNGKDDDKNGFIDDVHGWNFLGDSNDENLEFVRILRDKSLADAATVASAQKDFDAQYQQALGSKTQYEGMLQKITEADEALAKHFGKKNYTKEDVKAIKTGDEALLQSKVAVGWTSTLLSDKIGLSEKILSCNFSNFEAWDFPLDGICSFKDKDYQSFSERLKLILDLNHLDYFNKIEKNPNFVMNFDKNESVVEKTRKILKNNI